MKSGALQKEKTEDFHPADTAGVQSSQEGTVMSEVFSAKQAKQLSVVMAALFLLIHIFMLVTFHLHQVTPMIWFNVFSIAFYVVMLLLIRKNLLRIFVIATYLEINIHMAAAILCTGWEGGFQITLIGLCLLLFYSDYIARSLKEKRIPSLALCPVSVAVYIGTCLVSAHRPAPYSLPASVNTWLQVAWGVVVFGIIIVILDIFVLIATRSQEELSNEVFHDKLTGLPNRYYMSSVFSRMTVTENGESHWLAIADLDDFKVINDTYGHNCGDYVLKTVAEMLRGAPEDVERCRWGGEEFLFAGSGQPQDYLEGIRKAVENHDFNYQGQRIRMTLTFGYAWFRPGQSIDEWINAADKKLYEGKTAGKNRVVG